MISFWSVLQEICQNSHSDNHTQFGGTRGCVVGGFRGSGVLLVAVFLFAVAHLLPLALIPAVEVAFFVVTSGFCHSCFSAFARVVQFHNSGLLGGGGTRLRSGYCLDGGGRKVVSRRLVRSLHNAEVGVRTRLLPSFRLIQWTIAVRSATNVAGDGCLRHVEEGQGGQNHNWPERRHHWRG